MVYHPSADTPFLFNQSITPGVIDRKSTNNPRDYLSKCIGLLFWFI